MIWKSICIEYGFGGWGGLLIVMLILEWYKFIYIIGGNKLEIVDKIVDMIGMEVVDGFKMVILDNEIVLVIIDCGGILWCGIYFKKGILIVNVLLIGKSGLLVKYIVLE